VKPGRPELRLRLPRIERKPKAVYSLRFEDFAGVKRRPDLLNELDEIIDAIARGDGVPEKFYRAGIDDSPDPLLADKGIMHLHLGGKHSDVILFLIQYPEQVVLLETNSHIHLDQHPPGKNVLALSQSWLGRLEIDLERETARAAAALEESERRAAHEAQEKIREAIKAFKTRAKLE